MQVLHANDAWQTQKPFYIIVGVSYQYVEPVPSLLDFRHSVDTKVLGLCRLIGDERAKSVRRPCGYKNPYLATM